MAGLNFTSIIRSFFRSLGPAIIVASVVLGPGSILSSSKVGAAYGVRMLWVVVLAGGLMTGMVAMGARLGVVLRGTLCEELAARIGRPFAALVGLTIFLICAGFQFGNNLGVLAALDVFFPASSSDPGGADGTGVSSLLSGQNISIVALNVLVIGFLYRFRRLYRPLETMMKLLVSLMIIAFLGNFVYLLFAGLPDTGVQPLAESSAGPASTMDLVAVVGLIGTTFSVAGAFYQAYLVREKGWGLAHLKQGLVDSATGIGVLACITMVIMLTAAISFHGKSVPLESAADVARQLEPLFGPAALVLFGLGLFAAAFSSFLVNAMIGGAMLADGLGLGGSMDGMWTKRFTTLALLIGMIVAIFVPSDDRVGLLVFAQAMVVVGLPLLALSMLYLATRPDLLGARRVPGWMKVVGVIGLGVVLVSAGLLAAVILKKATDRPSSDDRPDATSSLGSHSGRQASG